MLMISQDKNKEYVCKTIHTKINVLMLITNVKGFNVGTKNVVKLLLNKYS